MSSAEGFHDRHVADDVYKFAVNCGGTVGELMMQRPASGRLAKHYDDDKCRHDDQSCGHLKAHRSDERNRANRCHARRQHVPDQHIFQREKRVRGSCNPRGECPGRVGREVAWCVTRHVAKKIAPHVAGDSNKRGVADPARHAPQEIVACNQSQQQGKALPDYRGVRLRTRQRVDQKLYRILRDN